jgi:tellurite resistance protein TerC
MDKTAGDILGAPLWFWGAFGAVIVGILVFDLGYLSRRIRVLSLGQSLLLTASYGLLAVVFGLGVWAYFGAEKGSLFFGAFLVVTGVRMIFDHEEEPDLSTNRAVQFFTRRLRITTDVEDDRFFLLRPERGSGQPSLHATRLFLAFMVINVADIVFAVDSVPAVLSMTQDPFIVYTSNIFAILGLRALYFVIDALIARFRYLRPALSFLLIFIGGVIFYERLIGEFDNVLTMVITFAVIGIAIVASVLRPGHR